MTSQVPATVRIISIVVWQSFLPVLLLLYVKPFQTFCIKKIKVKINLLRNIFVKDVSQKVCFQENVAEREKVATTQR